jgi:hypothetical protein
MNRDLAIILRHYGFLGGISTLQSYFCRAGDPSARVIFAPQKSEIHDLNIEYHDEPAHQLYYRPSAKRFLSLWKKPIPVYHALLPHISFTGESVEPVWVNEAGRAVIAWVKKKNENILLAGLDVVKEVIRHRQGDPSKVETTESKDRETWGFPGERPLYLFQDNLLPEYRTVPWADHLCFFFCEAISRVSGYPLVEPLPGGAKGAVILTGDDDQALLEKYGEQLQVIGNFPITYFLHYQTKHTEDTLNSLPPNVEIGLHPDALDKPEEYERLCGEQLAVVRQLVRKPIRILRNHGYLNDGYLGHLKVWEENGLVLDTNYPGLDGTALNGSFLPMRVRRPNGTWSNHYSFLTTFGDGMIYALKLSQRHAAKRIARLARQVERSYPGVLVFNFHPQNIADTHRLHEAVLELGRRPGWISLGLESYLEWLEILENLKLECTHDGAFLLQSPKRVENLVLRYPLDYGWSRKKLAAWSGEIKAFFS